MVVAVVMVMTVIVGMGVGVSHQNMLYYNITGVHAGPRTASRSRDWFARALLRVHAPREGAGKTGYALHPRSRALLAQKEMHTSIQVQREHSGLPCARESLRGKNLYQLVRYSWSVAICSRSAGDPTERPP